MTPQIKPSDEITPEQREKIIQELIDAAPEPLKKLGERLTDILDIEQYLLALAALSTLPQGRLEEALRPILRYVDRIDTGFDTKGFPDTVAVTLNPECGFPEHLGDLRAIASALKSATPQVGLVICSGAMKESIAANQKSIEAATQPPSGMAGAELLPCPFCGGRAALREVGPGPGGSFIHCDNDDCFGPQTTAANIEDATVQWNTRAAPTERDVSGLSDNITDRAKNLWSWMYAYMRDECSIDEISAAEQSNLITAIENELRPVGPLDRSLVEAAIEMLNSSGLHKIRVHGDMLDRKAIAAGLIAMLAAARRPSERDLLGLTEDERDLINHVRYFESLGLQVSPTSMKKLVALLDRLTGGKSC